MFQEHWDRVLVLLCEFEQTLRVLFMMLMIFFLLTLLSFFTVDPGSEVYLIVLYNLVMFGGGLVVVGIIFWGCRSRGR